MTTVHGTTELETRCCLANRTSFQKLQCKLMELLVVTLNAVCSSRERCSALKTLVCSARAAEAGRPVLNPSWAQSGFSLFSCSSWNKWRPGTCILHNVTLPTRRERAYGPSSRSCPQGSKFDIRAHSFSRNTALRQQTLKDTTLSQSQRAF